MDFTLPAPWYEVCAMSNWADVWTSQWGTVHTDDISIRSSLPYTSRWEHIWHGRSPVLCYMCERATLGNVHRVEWVHMRKQKKNNNICKHLICWSDLISVCPRKYISVSVLILWLQPDTSESLCLLTSTLWNAMVPKALCISEVLVAKVANKGCKLFINLTFLIWYAAVSILTLTSIFGMQSKPIKDWIPGFPALHRLIIPK